MLTSKPPADTRFGAVHTVLMENSSESVGADANVSAHRKALPAINTSRNEESGTERPSTGRHPLFLNADPSYERPREDSTSQWERTEAPPCMDANWSLFSHRDRTKANRSSFRDVPTRNQPSDDDKVHDDDDVSLGGMIVSLRNADHWRQA
jgi:hypothetical protein